MIAKIFLLFLGGTMTALVLSGPVQPISKVLPTDEYTEKHANIQLDEQKERADALDNENAPARSQTILSRKKRLVSWLLWSALRSDVPKMAQSIVWPPMYASKDYITATEEQSNTIDAKRLTEARDAFLAWISRFGNNELIAGEPDTLKVKTTPGMEPMHTKSSGKNVEKYESVYKS